MKHFLNLILVLIIVSLVGGCSSKKYFEPETVDGSYKAKSGTIGGEIIDFNKDGATLSNNTFITKDGIFPNKAGQGFLFINKIDNNIISADLSNNIAINEHIIPLDNIVISASVDKDILAVVYIDNSIAVYDIANKKTIFKEYIGESYGNDTKVTNPVFMSELILFPTLTGKVVVYSIENRNILREIIVDASNKQFKNITFFDVVDEQLIAATNNTMLSIGANLYSQTFEIKDIATKDNKIFVATIDGQIFVMDNKLKPYNNKKFTFGKIFGLGFGANHVYAVESTGYIIKMDMDLKNSSVLNLSFDAEEKFIITGDKIYFGDRYIELE
ncbi:MAG: hypothetical protein RBR07_03155 [Arcobacteraceae bacterium]|nr:hypothetical protein [Arcobacteraceae bacterium]